MTQTRSVRPLDPHVPFLADSIVSVTMGAACIVLAMPLTRLVGWNLPPEVLVGLGIFLIPWGGMNYLTSQIALPSKMILLGNIGVDATWLLGSVVVLIMTMSTLTPAGWILLIGQALGVLTMFLTKAQGVSQFHP